MLFFWNFSFILRDFNDFTRKIQVFVLVLSIIKFQEANLKFNIVLIIYSESEHLINI